MTENVRLYEQAAEARRQAAADKLTSLNARLMESARWSTSPARTPERELTAAQVEELRRTMGMPAWVMRMSYDSDGKRLPLAVQRSARKAY